MIIGVATFLIFLGFLCGLAFLAQGPQFAPTSDTNAKSMLEFARTHAVSRVLDLGSGDGKLVLLLARQGYAVDGVEINPLLVLRSRIAIRRAGLQDKAHIYLANFWRFDVSRYDLLVIFAIRHVIPRLEKKLLAELKPETYVLSNYFVFPNLPQTDQKNDVRIYKL
jgi:SAM-dependent methyltransferase